MSNHNHTKTGSELQSKRNAFGEQSFFKGLAWFFCVFVVQKGLKQ